MVKGNEEDEESTGEEPEGEGLAEDRRNDENAPRGGSIPAQQPAEEANEADKRLWRNYLKAQIRSTQTNLQGRGGTAFVIVAVIIYFIDGWLRYAGFIEFNWFKLPQTILGIVGSAPFLILFLIYILGMEEWSRGNLFAAISYAGVVILAIITGMAGLTWLAFAHLIFILLFWYLTMYAPARDSGETRKIVNANLLCMLLIFLDFYLYSFLKNFYAKYASVPLSIPILAFFVLVYTWRHERWNKVVGTLLVIIIVVFGLYNYPTLRLYITTAGVIGPEEAKLTPFDAFKKAGLGIKDLFADIQKSAEAQLEYATGGYYAGTVEENEKEQLGVYLENVEAADTNFLENEQVIVWGDLKARTLDEPIYVYMSCESGDVKGTISPKVLSNPEYSDNYQKGYEVQKLEEVGFECRFDRGQLATGTNTIKVKAEFNFKTLAFLKTYFMDIERIRALRRENVDPLAEYGVKDKTPTAVFTNGPVKLGMGTVDPPLGVYADNDAYSYVGVTVEKQWNGEIKSIKEITIQVPKVFELDPSGDFFCRGDFKKETETEDGYAVYNMTDAAIGKIKTPISQFRSWRCSMRVPKASAVLGKTPVTTFYYRAGVKYTYEIEQSLNVDIKAVAGEKTMLSGCELTCTDSDGCICDADNCKIPKGNYVGKDYTCNNYGGGASFTGGTVQDDLDYINTRQGYIEGMITFRNLCMRGGIGEINKAIDDLSGLSNEEKEQLKKDSVLTEGCGERSYRFFEITEGLIVDKAKEGVDRFKVLVSKSLADKKSEVNTEKTEFSNLLGSVIEHFKAIHNQGIITKDYEANINTVEGQKQELDTINFN